MLPYDDLRLLVHLDDEEGQGLVLLVLASFSEDTPELLPVDGVICLLEVYKSCIVTPFLALPGVDLGQDPGDMSCCRGVLLKACLVYPRLEQVRRQRSYLRHDGLLQDLCNVLGHNNRPDVLQLGLVLALVLG